ncbi:DUF6443 domain-containing protein [Chryseobacterium ginsenosidimutans]|uniref:DUF6443 domain-containing protein n=1 Tax=Chryseobacterium ginsenosidimutans TaxID=687846 RepID=UPI0031CE1DBC
MKKIIIPISTLFVSGLSFAQTTTTENYIQSRTYLEPVTASSSTAKQIETVQYFDGLGRPKQAVNVKASPTGKDVVTHIEYDGFGRQVKDYLPVPQQGTQNGAIYTTPLSNATQPSLYGAEKIYSEKILENSPLDRVLQQKQVGNDWNNKPVQFGYDANTTADAVKKYTTVTTWVNGATSSVLSQSTNYGTAQLYKNTVTDEDGNATIEFKNGEGQVLLVRKVISATENADTYYVYNEYNQLAFVISPKAAVASDPNTVLNDLCYQYKYDGRNRLVEKKLPGKGWEYMVYDKADRLVATQDANLRANNQWLYTKYDQFGRIVMTGLSIGYGNTRLFEQNNADTTGNSSVRRNLYVSFIVQGIEGYYENYDQTYPNSSRWVKLLSVNYYDTYPPETPAIPTQILGQDVLSQDAQNSAISTKSFPVSSYVKNIEDDNWTKNYTWYDTKGRAIGTHSINHLGGYTKTETLLDFAGVTQKTNTYHLRKQSETGVFITERFVYDSQNRLLQHYHQVDDKPEVLLADNTYNELSQLSNKKVGNNLQSIDYTYNIRGWLTDVNKDQMSVPDLGGKLFSYKIKYNQKDGIDNPDPAQFPGKNVSAKYNGNIAEVDWRSVENIGNNPSLTPKRYGYAYDKLNRLTAGYYQNPQNPNSKENTESLDYDLNGNITNLYRTSVTEYGNTTPTLIDNLGYVYASGGNSNKLTNINDSAYNATGYEGGGQTIDYDLNGNMTSIPDKAMNIQYNYLNLPSVVNMLVDFPFDMEYLYRADGVKLKKKNTSTVTGYNTVTITTNDSDYLDGFQYNKSTSVTNGGGGVPVDPPAEAMMLAPQVRAMEMQAFNPDEVVNFGPVGTLDIVKTPDLQFFPTAEGFYDYVKNQYIYQYKDHLGNARVSFGRNSAGALEVVDSNDYYPFGMNHLKSGNSFFGAGSYKNYKYNGKELQETGMYDYGARMYMSDIGRWGVVDPLAEKYRRWSPYNYTVNDPINHIDPDGMDIVETASGTTYTGSDAQSAFLSLKNSMSPTKEYPDDYKGKLGKGDWRKSDRENNTSVWQNANEYNIKQANGSNEYADLDQRADFYRWFQSATDKKGFQTRWSGAAATTVDNLKNLISRYDNLFGIDISNTEIRNFVRGGNKLILNHIWSSLQDLYSGPILKGQAAVNWDGQNLVNEQHLIQAEYNKLSPESVKILNSNLSWFTSFQGSVLNINHRWMYGMSSMGYTVKWEKGSKVNTNVKTR